MLTESGQDILDERRPTQSPTARLDLPIGQSTYSDPGRVRLDQIRTYDLVERKAKYVETLPGSITAALVLEYLNVIHDI